MADVFMVFDVESVGLHGDAFAVGWTVVNRDGDRLGEGCISCPIDLCNGDDRNRVWVEQNVPKLVVTNPTPEDLRDSFWKEWIYWSTQGAVLVADCSWPVEANFLSSCVKMSPEEREWTGPYPLHDLASMLLIFGVDPRATTDRLPDELPAHHPQMDARQSARHLVACLRRAKGVV